MLLSPSWPSRNGSRRDGSKKILPRKPPFVRPRRIATAVPSRDIERTRSSSLLSKPTARRPRGRCPKAIRSGWDSFDPPDNTSNVGRTPRANRCPERAWRWSIEFRLVHLRSSCWPLHCFSEVTWFSLDSTRFSRRLTSLIVGDWSESRKIFDAV